MLDPFLGTGTTAVAAKSLGRHFVGVDLDVEYVKIAQDKLAKVKETIYQGYFVSYFLGKIQSIRDIDAAKIYPTQLTSIEKRRSRDNGNNGHSLYEGGDNPVAAQMRILEKKASYRA